MQTIKVNQLRSLLHRESADEAIIIDVRTPAEYNNEHIEGTANVPLDEIERHIDSLRSYRHVYIHCASGNRSTQACQKLSTLGMDNFVNVDGGLNAWKDEGFPVYRGEKFVLPIMQQVQIAAGSLAFVGAVLGLLVNPMFVLISGVVGAGLTISGVTGTCTMGLLLARMPWNRA